MRRIGLLIAGVVSVSACAAAPVPGEATSADATAAYVLLDDDRTVSDDLFFPLVMAAPGEPSEPAGFIPGLRSASAVADVRGGFGLQLVFQDYATTADRERLKERTLTLGLGLPLWLGAVDYWPDCEGEPDCFLVGDTPSLP